MDLETGGRHYHERWAGLVYDFYNNHFASLLFLEGAISFLQVNGSDSPNKHKKRRCAELHTNELKKLFVSNYEVFRKYLKDKERVKEAMEICKEQVV